MFPFLLERQKTKEDAFGKLEAYCQPKEIGRMGAQKHFNFGQGSSYQKSLEEYVSCNPMENFDVRQVFEKSKSRRMGSIRGKVMAREGQIFGRRWCEHLI